MTRLRQGTCAALLLALPATAHGAASSSALLDASFGARPLSMMALLGALALLPFAVLMLTSFSKIAVVLSIARSALGSQQIPPTTVLTGLSLVLSLHIMAPVFEQMWAAAQAPQPESDTAAGLVARLQQASQPMRAFLLEHARPEDRALFAQLARELRGLPAPEAEAEAAGSIAPDAKGPGEAAPREARLAVLVPAFLVSELKEAFRIGFLVFLPFLVLDMVVANVLMALGMPTLAPTCISLPLKLLLFVMVDGWGLLARGLVLGYR